MNTLLETTIQMEASTMMRNIHRSWLDRILRPTPRSGC